MTVVPARSTHACYANHANHCKKLLCREDFKVALGVQDFVDSSAPALMPIFQAAKGETLLLLLRSTPTLLQSMPRPYVTSMMVPLLVRAADQGKRILIAASESDALTVVGRVCIHRSDTVYCRQPEAPV